MVVHGASQEPSANEDWIYQIAFGEWDDLNEAR